MKRQKQTKVISVLVLAALVVMVALVLPARAWAHGPADGAAKTSDINELFTIIFWISVPVFLLVEGLVLYAIWTSSRRRNEPEQIEGNHALEITWTVLSFAIVAVVFILSYRFMSTEYRVEADQEDTIPDYTVDVTGHQYYWDYKYYREDAGSPGDDTGVRTTIKMTIPTNRNVLLNITSADVQHSFWVPELAGKIDAIPGYTNTMWLNVDEPGLYTGNCAEYCGTLHWDMLIEVEALEPAEFDMWLAKEEEAAGKFVPVGQDLTTPLPEGDAEQGEVTFEKQNCAACHGEQPSAGPSLSQIAGHADKATEMGYDSFADYLRESVLMPCANEFEGFYCTTMPDNYGELLNAQMLADIIAYLESYE